jgi:hypothetical protein
MKGELLTPFWIETPNSSHGPIGYGVTAWSYDDAQSIIRAFGYDLPTEQDSIRIHENIRFAELPAHVREHMGPIVVRGMWYPFYRLGV